MALPELEAVQAATTTFSINLTYVITISVFCITTMATVINLFGAKRADRIAAANRQKDAEETKRIEEFKPGLTAYCKQHEKDLGRVEELTKENRDHYEAAQLIVNKMVTEVATLQHDKKNTDKTIDEMKENNKDVAKKLDGLLQQLMELMNK